MRSPGTNSLGSAYYVVGMSTCESNMVTLYKENVLGTGLVVTKVESTLKGSRMDCELGFNIVNLLKGIKRDEINGGSAKSQHIKSPDYVLKLVAGHLTCLLSEIYLIVLLVIGTHTCTGGQNFGSP